MASRIQKLREEVRLRRQARRSATIALDAMGSDAGPDELMQGAYDAVTALHWITVICAGPSDKLEAIIRRRELAHPRLRVEHAPQVVTMDEAPKDSLRKKDSSVSVAARLVHEGRAAAMLSAGNTGATMATAMMTWRQLPGISRPAIAAVIPHPRHPSIILDVGANVDCKPRHLLHFAIMGAVYARHVFRRRNPRVGLLSIGEEETKGNEQIFDTQKLMRQSTLNYCGNAEGRDLFREKFDVVVCDGFVGNVVLKVAEGLVEFIFDNLKQQIQSNLVAQIGALGMKPVLRSFKKTIDHSEYGGAPLLGLNGNCIICHGSSRAKSIMNAIRVADEMAGANVNRRIVELLKQNTPDSQ
ncbi:MAG: phosphate acyltransferase PlsX [Candidatus Sumerlaeota bacterium]|nr:phosphate acyltransferase PlsX [Candidatus Sumerlaeota bacterium]